MKNTILALATFFCCIVHLAAQNHPRTALDDYLDAYIGTNATPYLQPVADLVTTNINTGVWDWSSIPNKVYFRIKANGMLSIPSQSMRTFNGHTSGDFTPTQSAIVPTIIGDKESIVLQGDNKSVYVFPGGFDVDAVTLGTPQVTIGGFFHTEMSVRFLTFDLGNHQGKVDFIGIGGRHSITDYFEDPPFDLSVGYFYHYIKTGDYVKSDQHLVSIILGKSGKFFSGHVSAGYQKAIHRMHYLYEDDNESYEAKLDLENSNPFIVEAGGGAKLGPIFLNAAVSYARFYTFALGAGLTF